MSDFDKFYDELILFIKNYEKENILIKTEKDPESDIVKIFGEKISALAKAKNGLQEITELSYTTAEHHPYWNLLYNVSEIAQTLLEKWDDKLDSTDLNDIKWAIKEINQTLEKIESTNKHS